MTCFGNGPVGACANARPGRCSTIVSYEDVRRPVSKRMEIAAAAGESCGGKSIIEMLEDELDTVIDRLMTGAAAGDGRDPGRAEGVAFALAVMQNPYRPNINSVKNDAMVRWEESQEP